MHSAEIHLVFYELISQEELSPFSELIKKYKFLQPLTPELVNINSIKEEINNINND